MKVLWVSNAPFAGSGYGVQTRLFGPRIAAAGHDLVYYANWGVQGHTLSWDGARMFPTDNDWGNRTMAACAANHAGDLEACQIIVLCDSWVLRPDDWPDGIRVAVWAPVDMDPLPAKYLKVLGHERVRPIAMSRFGEAKMRDRGLDPLYVPHGVDTGVFRPQQDRQPELRAELNIPEDAFVVGMVAANRCSPLFSRKCFPQVLQAFSKFRETHRDAFLYLHTNEMIDPDKGLLLRKMASACGIPRRSMRITDPLQWEMGVSAESVAALYSCFDVTAHPSAGEGFGVPIIESLACGTPVIANNWTSMPELVGAGWLTDGDLWYHALHDSWWKVPTVASIVGALELAYESRGDTVLRNNARKFALAYDADRVFDEYWVPVLEALGGPREVPPLGERIHELNDEMLEIAENFR